MDGVLVPQPRKLITPSVVPITAEAVAIHESALKHLEAIARAVMAGATLGSVDTRIRVKSTHSISLKLAENPGHVIHDGVAAILTFPPRQFAERLQSARRAIQDHGHALDQARNYFREGNRHYGMHDRMLAPDGFPWEIQYHTPESLALLDHTHGLYEEFRLPSTPQVRKVAIAAYMTTQALRLEIPQGVELLGELKVNKPHIRHLTLPVQTI